MSMTPQQLAELSLNVVSTTDKLVSWPSMKIAPPPPSLTMLLEKFPFFVVIRLWLPVTYTAPPNCPRLRFPTKSHSLKITGISVPEIYTAPPLPSALLSSKVHRLSDTMLVTPVKYIAPPSSSAVLPTKLLSVTVRVARLTYRAPPQPLSFVLAVQPYLFALFCVKLVLLIVMVPYSKWMAPPLEP